MNTSGDLIRKLSEGNARFVAGKLTQKDLPARRAELVVGQKPWCIVLSCSDSRVVPEYIFDTSLGELFVVRTAGNVADPIGLGSIEYGAEHLHAPLLLVLGHESCGAVGACCDGQGKGGEGHITDIVKAVGPAAEKAGFDKVKAVEENVRCTMTDLPGRSKILAHLLHEKKLSIVGGVYSLSTGRVRFLA